MRKIVILAKCLTALAACFGIMGARALGQDQLNRQLIGIWTNTGGSGVTFRIEPGGDVWTSDFGLARTASTIEAGGNFAFEGRQGSSPYKCVYYITFLSDINRSNWKPVLQSGAIQCPNGVFERSASVGQTVNLQPNPAPQRPTSPYPTSAFPSQPDSRESVISWIQDYFIRDAASYASNVQWYEKGIVDEDFVRRDKRDYADRWPMRQYFLRPASVDVVPRGSNIEVSFELEFRVMSPIRGQQRTGLSTTFLTVRHQNGGFVILKQNEKVTIWTK